MRTVTLLLLALRLLGGSWSVVCMKMDGAVITPEQVKNIYYKTVTQLNTHTLFPLNLPAASPARSAFLQQVLGVDFQTWDAYYDERHFEGIPPPKVVPSAEAMKRFLHNMQGAVGYLPSESVDASMTEIMRFEVAVP